MLEIDKNILISFQIHATEADHFTTVVYKLLERKNSSGIYNRHLGRNKLMLFVTLILKIVFTKTE